MKHKRFQPGVKLLCSTCTALPSEKSPSADSAEPDSRPLPTGAVDASSAIASSGYFAAPSKLNSSLRALRLPSGHRDCACAGCAPQAKRRACVAAPSGGCCVEWLPAVLCVAGECGFTTAFESIPRQLSKDFSRGFPPQRGSDRVAVKLNKFCRARLSYFPNMSTKFRLNFQYCCQHKRLTFPFFGERKYIVSNGRSGLRARIFHRFWRVVLRSRVAGAAVRCVSQT